MITLVPGSYHLDVPTDYGAAGGDYNLTVGYRPEPQTFDISVGDTISDGQPAPGAGNLEEAGSVDLYRFTVTQPGYVTVTADVCPSGLTGDLQGTSIISSFALCGQRRLLLYPDRYTVTGTPATYTFGLAGS